VRSVDANSNTSRVSPAFGTGVLRYTAGINGSGSSELSGATGALFLASPFASAADATAREEQSDQRNDESFLVVLLQFAPRAAAAH
jgi:hypothetical protein